MTVESYRTALRLAGIDPDRVRGCEERSHAGCWSILLGSVWYTLTPDGRYGPMC